METQSKKFLANPNPGDEVIISGIAGYFPKCNSVAELQQKLFDKEDLINDKAYGENMVDVLGRIGKMSKLEKFDSDFFRENYLLGHCQDPITRLLLERTYEALIDAGINPVELRNSKTGVYIGACFVESENMLLYDQLQVNENGIVGWGDPHSRGRSRANSNTLLECRLVEKRASGQPVLVVFKPPIGTPTRFNDCNYKQQLGPFLLCSRASFATQISNWLQVTGPAYSVDTACSSSTFALEQAYKAIREGHCDTAIVGGANVCLQAEISYHFDQLGVLSKNCRCRSFDNAGDGYVRSEAIVVCILQKAKDSKRIYAQIVHTKTNCDGFTEQGITYPAMELHKRLLREVYEESSVLPQNIEFMECHGTGTPVGDPNELDAIDSIMCKGRKEPLLIGSVKSNLGHSEPAAGLCSIAKLCIAYNSGYIPPNIHFRNRREDIPALVEGRLRVVTDKLPWNRGHAGISSLGFGGANAHVLLKNIAKEKENSGLPQDDLPRLVCASGRTRAAVNHILSSLEAKPVDVEEIRLWHSIHENDIDGHGFRGYALLESRSNNTVSVCKDIARKSNECPTACFSYPGRGSHWATMAKQLMKLPIFAVSIKKCHEVLRGMGIDLINVIKSGQANVNSVDSYVVMAAAQIGLTNVMTAIGIKPEYIIGDGAGEIICAYTDDCLTLEQAMLVAYYRGMASKEVQSMENNSTGEINGRESDVFDNALNELTAKGVKVNQITPKVLNIGIRLSKHLTEVVSSAKIRSERWLSTSVHRDEWMLPESALCSAEYYLNNFLKQDNMFNEACQMIPPNCILIEMAPQPTLRNNAIGNVKNAIHMTIGNDSNDRGLEIFFQTLGKLFQAGLNPRLANIYPYVSFPVSQGTPMLSHLVEWFHEEDWLLDTHIIHKEKCSTVERTVSIDLENEVYKYLKGHIVDGRVIFPGMGYVVLVWETLALMMGKWYKQLPVVFEDVNFERSTIVPKTGQLKLTVTIHRISGDFEVSENNSTVVTGRVCVKKCIVNNFDQISESVSGKADKSTCKMKSSDFYKAFRLRGYGHCDDFQGILECDVEGLRFKLAWIKNWTTFLDTMLQTFIFREDTTNILLPTRFEKLSIDTIAHYDYVERNKTKHIEAYSDKYINVASSPGVELRGVHCTPVVQKLALATPVLEKHVFVPLEERTLMTTYDVLRTYIQVMIENVQFYTIKGVEVIDGEYKEKALEPIIQNVASIFQDQPLNNAELAVVTDEEVKLPTSIVTSKKLEDHKNFTFVIASNLLGRPDVLERCGRTLGDKGFIITREAVDIKEIKCPDKYNIISLNNVGTESIVMLKKREELRNLTFVEVKTGDMEFSYIEKIKEEINKDATLVIFSNDEYSGLVGLVNCLRKETGGEKIRGFLIKDASAPAFNPSLEFYRQQLEKNLTINVYEDGKWGTYRHLVLKELDQLVPVHHAYNNVEVIGDLSSLKWYEGSLDASKPVDPEMILVHVYCAALNFRDVMTATGRVAVHAVCRERLHQDCVQGLEVVGRTANGTRVMAMPERGLSNMTLCPKDFVMAIPDEWSFEEAATVFVAYSTVYIALVVFGKIKRGQSVLIHAGSGGVGQAAINVALSYGCEVFTTVGTDQKRKVIKKLFPQIEDSHIGCSRDTSFEEMIHQETKGRGVDVVLNSLAEDKLLATARCLASGGRFLEIGKFDIFKNTQVEMYFHEKEISFHGVMLDFIYEDKCTVFRKKIIELIASGIASGAVRPTTYTAFGKDEVEPAFRYMASGKHVGKVIIKLRDEEPQGTKVIPAPLKINAIRRYTCHSDNVYVLIGGLGGFGLELADWLVLRGARKLVFVSRSGVQNGYQSMKLRLWRSYGVDITLSTHDVTTEAGCEAMLRTANSLGPVEAVFNLALVLKDLALQQQNPETFSAVHKPKASVAFNLDRLTRKLCPGLKDFVMFSSFVSGRGNVGQVNYGSANSVMERICERRREEGLPALAIQWGAIGDVGVLQESLMASNTVTSSIVPQSIASCLRTLDKFLKQQAAVVSSYIPVEKTLKSKVSRTAVDTVAKIMGIRDMKTISHQATLAELGMDSMVAMEIKQTLERDYEIILSAQEIRTLTFAKLSELSKDKQKSVTNPTASDTDEALRYFNLRVMINTIGDESNINKPFIYMPSVPNTSPIASSMTQSPGNMVFMVPGIESCAATLEPLCQNLKYNSCVLQLGVDHLEEDIPAMVNRLYENLNHQLQRNQPFCLIGYSYGTILAIELAAKLENEGLKGFVLCIDGSPLTIKFHVNNKFTAINAAALQNKLIRRSIELITPNNETNTEAMAKIDEIRSFDDKIDYAIKMTSNLKVNYSDDYIKRIIKTYYYRIKVIDDYKIEEIKKIESPIALIRSKIEMAGVPEDYGLGKLTKKDVNVHCVEGDHTGVLKNEECAKLINKYIDNNRN